MRQRITESIPRRGHRSRRRLAALAVVVAVAGSIATIAGPSAAGRDGGLAGGVSDLMIGPIDGLTTAWHPAPERTGIPAGVAIFRIEAPTDATVDWRGAIETTRDGRASIAVCPLLEPGIAAVGVTVRHGGKRLERACELEVLDVDPADVLVGHVRVATGELAIDGDLVGDALNQRTMELWFGPSIAAVRHLGGDRYRTAVSTPVEVASSIEPAALAPLLEWRLDGRPAGIGPWRTVVAADVGTHRLAAGPPASERMIELETYAVSIEIEDPDVGFGSRAPGVVDGRPIAFVATTDPPGHEDEVTWLASTKYGGAEPVTARGPRFEVVFDGTHGRHPAGGFHQWLGVKADHQTVGQDQKVDVSTFWDTLQLNDVPEGETAEGSFFIVNGEDEPLSLTSVTLLGGAPFVVVDDDPVIGPGGVGEVRVALGVTGLGTHEDTLLIGTDRPGVEFVVPVSATVRPANALPIEDTATLDAGFSLAEPLEDGGGQVFINVTHPPIGPSQGEEGLTMELSIAGVLPPGVDPFFDDDVLPLGGFEATKLTIVAPPGTPAIDSEITIVGSVFAEGVHLFDVLSPVILIPSSVWLFEFGPCECPPGVPPPTLMPLDDDDFDVPDAQPPDGDDHSDHIVAKVEAKLEGPQAGECCVDAQFKLTATIDSQPAGANESITAFFLIKALCGQTVGGTPFSIAACTNGFGHPIGRGAGNSGIACPGPAPADFQTTGRVVLETSYIEPVLCVGGGWPCKVVTEEFKTKLDLKSTDSGAIEIFWNVEIAGTDCTITSVSGEITRIVYLHDSDDTPPKRQVYDPINDEFYDVGGDPDADGRKNYEEVIEGKDPETVD